MKSDHFLAGVGFGLTSGIITTMGLMIGLGSGTNSEIVVMAGIITIAIADSFSDALGVHVLQESQKTSEVGIKRSTWAAFATKLFFTLSFLVPVLVFPIGTAIVVGAIWGILALSVLSMYVAKIREDNVGHAVVSHVATAMIVVILSWLVGESINRLFV